MGLNRREMSWTNLNEIKVFSEMEWYKMMWKGIKWNGINSNGKEWYGIGRIVSDGTGWKWTVMW